MSVQITSKALCGMSEEGKTGKASVAGKTTGLCWWHWEGGSSALLPSERCFSCRTPATSHAMSWPYRQRGPCESPTGWQAGWESQHRGPPNQQLVLAFCALLVPDVSKVVFPREEKCKSRTGNKERKVCLELKGDGATRLCSYWMTVGAEAARRELPPLLLR